MLINYICACVSVFITEAARQSQWHACER